MEKEQQFKEQNKINIDQRSNHKSIKQQRLAIQKQSQININKESLTTISSKKDNVEQKKIPQTQFKQTIRPPVWIFIIKNIKQSQKKLINQIYRQYQRSDKNSAFPIVSSLRKSLPFFNAVSSKFKVFTDLQSAQQIYRKRQIYQKIQKIIVYSPLQDFSGITDSSIQLNNKLKDLKGKNYKKIKGYQYNMQTFLKQIKLQTKNSTQFVLQNQQIMCSKKGKIFHPTHFFLAKDKTQITKYRTILTGFIKNEDKQQTKIQFQLFKSLLQQLQRQKQIKENQNKKQIERQQNKYIQLHQKQIVYNDLTYVSILKCYSQQSLFYPTINNFLRFARTIEDLQMIGFPTRQLFLSIENFQQRSKRSYFKEIMSMNKEDQIDYKKFQKQKLLYRGTVFNQLIKKGDYLQQTGFMSTSKSFEQAMKFFVDRDLEIMNPCMYIISFNKYYLMSLNEQNQQNLDFGFVLFQLLKDANLKKQQSLHKTNKKGYEKNQSDQDKLIGSNNQNKLIDINQQELNLIDNMDSIKQYQKEQTLSKNKIISDINKATQKQTQFWKKQGQVLFNLFSIFKVLKISNQNQYKKKHQNNISLIRHHLLTLLQRQIYKRVIIKGQTALINIPRQAQDLLNEQQYQILHNYLNFKKQFNDQIKDRGDVLRLLDRYKQAIEYYKGKINKIEYSEDKIQKKSLHKIYQKLSKVYLKQENFAESDKYLDLVIRQKQKQQFPLLQQFLKMKKNIQNRLTQQLIQKQKFIQTQQIQQNLKIISKQLNDDQSNWIQNIKNNKIIARFCFQSGSIIDCHKLLVKCEQFILKKQQNYNNHQKIIQSIQKKYSSKLKFLQFFSKYFPQRDQNTKEQQIQKIVRQKKYFENNKLEIRKLILQINEFLIQVADFRQDKIQQQKRRSKVKNYLENYRQQAKQIQLEKNQSFYVQSVIMEARAQFNIEMQERVQKIQRQQTSQSHMILSKTIKKIQEINPKQKSLSVIYRQRANLKIKQIKQIQNQIPKEPSLTIEQKQYKIQSELNNAISDLKRSLQILKQHNQQTKIKALYIINDLSHVYLLKKTLDQAEKQCKKILQNQQIQLRYHTVKVDSCLTQSKIRMSNYSYKQAYQKCIIAHAILRKSFDFRLNNQKQKTKYQKLIKQCPKYYEIQVLKIKILSYCRDKYSKIGLNQLKILKNVVSSSLSSTDRIGRMAQLNELHGDFEYLNRNYTKFQQYFLASIYSRKIHKGASQNIENGLTYCKLCEYFANIGDFERSKQYYDKFMQIGLKLLNTQNSKCWIFLKTRSIYYQKLYLYSKQNNCGKIQQLDRYRERQRQYLDNAIEMIKKGRDKQLQRRKKFNKHEQQRQMKIQRQKQLKQQIQQSKLKQRQSNIQKQRKQKILNKEIIVEQYKVIQLTMRIKYIELIKQNSNYEDFKKLYTQCHKIQEQIKVIKNNKHFQQKDSLELLKKLQINLQKQKQNQKQNIQNIQNIFQNHIQKINLIINSIKKEIDTKQRNMMIIENRYKRISKLSGIQMNPQSPIKNKQMTLSMSILYSPAQSPLLSKKLEQSRVTNLSSNQKLQSQIKSIKKLYLFTQTTKFLEVSTNIEIYII